MIDSKSRYQLSVLLKEKKGETLGLRPLISNDPQDDDQFHTVVAGDRIDLIAARYLGDARWWWVICDFNNLFFPLELETGSVLRMPSEGRLKTTLRQL